MHLEGYKLIALGDTLRGRRIIQQPPTENDRNTGLTMQFVALSGTKRHFCWAEHQTQYSYTPDTHRIQKEKTRLKQ